GFHITPYSFLLIIPFIPAMAAGFIYNAICDAAKDPKFKNPITNGTLPKEVAQIVAIAFALISAILFFLLYSSLVALSISTLYLILWFAYSGLKIRFKETYLAPIVASFVLWVGAPLILVAEFNSFKILIDGLLLGLFFVFFSFEVNHTIGDYDLDLKYDCRTFAVRVGQKKAIIAKHITLSFGYALILLSAYFLLDASNMILVFLPLFPLTQTVMILYDKKRIRLDRKMYENLFFVSPFFVIKFFLIIFSVLVMNFQIQYSLFFIWLFLIDKNSFTV
ncbi:MAG: UbiA family prenyltransferase, partial [Candidatus Bathyarchaeia archaeon]